MVAAPPEPAAMARRKPIVSKANGRSGVNQSFNHPSFERGQQKTPPQASAGAVADRWVPTNVHPAPKPSTSPILALLGAAAVIEGCRTPRPDSPLPLAPAQRSAKRERAETPQLPPPPLSPLERRALEDIESPLPSLSALLGHVSQSHGTSSGSSPASSPGGGGVDGGDHAPTFIRTPPRRGPSFERVARPAVRAVALAPPPPTLRVGPSGPPVPPPPPKQQQEQQQRQPQRQHQQQQQRRRPELTEQPQHRQRPIQMSACGPISPTDTVTATVTVTRRHPQYHGFYSPPAAYGGPNPWLYAPWAPHVQSY
ncbi:unnamed protein product [Phaeothamnion confervicola]